MTGGPLLAGVDVGTTSTKALLLGVDGQEVAYATRPTPFLRDGEQVDMSATDLRSVLMGTLEDLGSQLGRVVGIGVAGMGEAGVPLDRAGEPCGPIVGWQDPRGEEVVRRLKAAGGVLEERLGRRMTAVSSVAKLGWLLEEGCPVVAWAGVPEFCAMLLGAERATDPSLASRVGCFDVWQGAYIPEVLGDLGVGPRMFPEPVPAGTLVGRLSADAAARTMLPAGAPIAIAGHDHVAGAEATAEGPGDLLDSAGTAEVILKKVDRPVRDIGNALQHRVAISAAPSGSGWWTMASVARTGELRARGSRLLDEDVAELDRVAGKARPGDASALLEAVEQGLTFEPPILKPSLWRGFLHDMARRGAEAYDRSRAVAGPAERVIVFGGGALSDAWMQARQSEWSIPVSRSSSRQAVARGAALVAGVAAGCWPEVAAGPRATLDADFG